MWWWRKSLESGGNEIDIGGVKGASASANS